MYPHYKNRKDEIDVTHFIETEFIAVLRLDEGVRKQKPKRGEFNTLYDEKDDDTFKSFRDQKR